jgi:hypothetical protein
LVSATHPPHQKTKRTIIRLFRFQPLTEVEEILFHNTLIQIIKGSAKVVNDFGLQKYFFK